MLGLGYNIISSPYMVERVRVKTSRKKRIDKKWLKRYGYEIKPMIVFIGQEIRFMLIRLWQRDLKKK
jgi:hypothetical protein